MGFRAAGSSAVVPSPYPTTRSLKLWVNPWLGAKANDVGLRDANGSWNGKGDEMYLVRTSPMLQVPAKPQAQSPNCEPTAREKFLESEKKELQAP